MDSRRFTTFLLGIWLGCSLFMTALAIVNFKIVEQLLERPTIPAAAKQFQSMGYTQARLMMRHQAGEVNRYFFETWGWTQAVLGLAVLGLLVFEVRSRWLRWMLGLAGGMLILVLVNQLAVTPTIVGLGRILDFNGPDKLSAERARFWNFHSAYTTLEVVKMLLGVALLVLMSIQQGRRRRTGLDTLDEPEETLPRRPVSRY